mgnify:CR=1 FL=1
MQLSQYSAANDSGRCAEQMLAQVLAPLREDYDYIIIDCGLKQELLTVNALSASDSCIIPVQSHFLASEGIPDVLDMVRSVQKRFNPELKIAGLLLTMYQSRPQLCQSVRAAVAELYGDSLRVFERPIEQTIKVAEFPSVGTGGLALSGKEHAVVVSMGTGTSFLWANKGQEVRHLIGSGVGGGTLAGLSSLTTGVHQYALIRKLCQDGDLSQIDLTIGDMSKGKVGTLPPEATAANFAKLAEDATSADKMRGLVNLVLQAIGTMSVLACRTCGTNTVVLTGALTMLPPAHETFELFTQLYGVEYIIPENATFATAIGAALYSMRRDR